MNWKHCSPRNLRRRTTCGLTCHSPWTPRLKRAPKGGRAGDADRAEPGIKLALRLSIHLSPLTTHMPFHAAMSVANPMISSKIGSTRHARPTELNVRRMSARMPATMTNMPRPRAKMTRGRLPLQMAHRMKLGWA